MIGKYFHQKKIKSLHNSVSFAECLAMISKDNRKIVSKTWNINWLFLLTLFKTFNAEELFVCNIHYINYIKESEREREREREKKERCLTFFVMLMRNSANIQTESHYKKGKILWRDAFSKLLMQWIFTIRTGSYSWSLSSYYYFPRIYLTAFNLLGLHTLSWNPSQ